MKDRDNYIQTQLKRSKSKHFKIYGAVIVTLLFIVVIAAYKMEALSLGSAISEKVNKPLSQELRRQSQKLKMEQDAKKVFGSDVVWVEFPRSSYREFNKIAMSYISSGEEIGFKGTRSKNYTSCVSRRCAEELEEKVDGCVIVLDD